MRGSTPAPLRGSLRSSDQVNLNRPHGGRFFGTGRDAGALPGPGTVSGASAAESVRRMIELLGRRHHVGTPRTDTHRQPPHRTVEPPPRPRVDKSAAGHGSSEGKGTSTAHPERQERGRGRDGGHGHSLNATDAAAWYAEAQGHEAAGFGPAEAVACIRPPDQSDHYAILAEGLSIDQLMLLDALMSALDGGQPGLDDVQALLLDQFVAALDGGQLVLLEEIMRLMRNHM